MIEDMHTSIPGTFKHASLRINTDSAMVNLSPVGQDGGALIASVREFGHSVRICFEETDITRKVVGKKLCKKCKEPINEETEMNYAFHSQCWHSLRTRSDSVLLSIQPPPETSCCVS
jgi:hypothetical protein